MAAMERKAIAKHAARAAVGNTFGADGLEAFDDTFPAPPTPKEVVEEVIEMAKSRGDPVG